MALPKPPIAVYYGTITLKDGTVQTYTASQIATLYNVNLLPYTAVPLVGPSPFKTGQEIRYIHLKPQTDPSLYFDAQDRYNYNETDYFDDDFDAHEGGKWAVRPRNPDPDATD